MLPGAAAGQCLNGTVQGMDLNDTPDLAAYRAEVRAWLEAHAAAAPPDRDDVAAHRAWQRELAEGGLAAVTWPA